MNGHLQLSISLKNYNEIQAAIDLLQSLLPQTPLNKPFPKKTGFYAVATKGDLVKLSTTKPKPTMLPNDKNIENLKRAKFSTTPEDEWKRIDTERKKNLLIRRARTQKMKRNKKGQFLKQKK